MSQTTGQLSEAQRDLLGAIDYAVESAHDDLRVRDYQGVSTCGFASIVKIDGRKSFVKRLKKLAEHGGVSSVSRDSRGDLRIRVGGFHMSVREDSYRGGYRLSVTNQDILEGAETQRMDWNEDLHSTLLRAFRKEGYLDEARRTSRVD